MKKNMIIFIIVLVLLFGALGFIVNYQNKQKVAGNPFNKDNLHPKTIEQLDDPLYQNQILPDELAVSLANGDDLTVYFYASDCIHCQNTTPIVVPMTEDMGIDLVKHNLREFDESWGTYGIEGTPTIVHYEDGKEVARIYGAQPEAQFEQFFQENVLSKEEN